ncbi:MAG: hypothetical protein EZS28_048105, partial [Streblomastix strix]
FAFQQIKGRGHANKRDEHEFESNDDQDKDNEDDKDRRHLTDLEKKEREKRGGEKDVRRDRDVQREQLNATRGQTDYRDLDNIGAYAPNITASSELDEVQYAMPDYMTPDYL